MLLWIVIALLTAAAIMAVLAPLGRAAVRSGHADHSRQVYRDQLEELRRDLAQGQISAAEAEAARAEIARRLIAADRDAEPVRPEGSITARRAAALVALIGIPMLSLGLYLSLGAPHLPGQSLAARLGKPAAPDDIETLVARVEEHLARQPEDGAGWDVIAPVYLRLGRAADAEAAYRNAIRLLGSSGARQSGLGEAILAAQGGIVTADARAAFEAAAQAEPSAPAPRFFLALAEEQGGNPQEAAKRWRALLAEAAPDAPWRAAVEQALARVDPTSGPGSPLPGAIAAAGAAEAADQTAMIEGMVNRLAERLKREPDDVEGWLRLIRSYVVMGRPQDAAAAAREALQGLREQGSRARVEALIADLGVAAGAAVAQ